MLHPLYTLILILFECLRWSLLTIIHWFFWTSFLIFVVFIPMLHPLYTLTLILFECLRWSLLTIIHWFFWTSFLIFVVFIPNASSTVHSDPHSIWMSKMKSSYYYTLIHLDQFPYLCCLYPNASSTVHSDPHSIWMSEMKSSYYYTLIHLDQFPYLCCLYHNASSTVHSDPHSIWMSKMKSSYYYTLIHLDQFPYLCCLYPKCFIHCTLWPSFYLNVWDEVFLLLYIDSFGPDSSSLLSLSQCFCHCTLWLSFYLDVWDEVFLLLYIVFVFLTNFLIFFVRKALFGYSTLQPFWWGVVVIIIFDCWYFEISNALLICTYDFGLVSLFYGFSTFLGYLMLKPLLKKNCRYYLTHSWVGKGVHTFPKCISLKMNVTVTGVWTCLFRGRSPSI